MKWDTKEYKNSILSFILGALSMWLTLVFADVGFGGDKTIVSGDLLQIYLPAVKNICRDILLGESIYYAWNTSMGMNTALYNAFYALSPINILYILFNKSNIFALTASIVILKTGLSAMAFQIYARRSLSASKFWAVVISICYSMCSFQVAYNTLNVIWLDALIILPVVFLCIDMILDGTGQYGLTWAFIYIFISQFYMGYMIGIISAVYIVLAVLCRFMNDKKTPIVYPLLRIALRVVLAVGVSAFVWLPTLFFIINSRASDSTSFVANKIRITEIIRTLYWGSVNSGEGNLPNTYSGILIIALVTLFFICSDIKKNTKVLYGFLCLFVIVGFLWLPLYKLWHGFETPDGWPYRFSYILSFIMCVMAAKVTRYLDNIRIKTAVFAAWIDIVLYVVCEYLCSFYGRTGETKKALINIALLTLWWGVIILLNFTKCRSKEKRVLKLLICVLAIAEATTLHEAIYTTSKISLEVWYDSMENSLSELKSDEGFYRVNSIYDPCVNSGTLFGFNGVGHFASAENGNVRKALGLLGIYGSPRIMMNYGITPVTECLFDIKYTLHGIFEDVLLRKGDEGISAVTQKNPNALSVGYMISGRVSDYNFDGENVFENNNYIISMMTGHRITPFKYIEEGSIIADGNGLNISLENGIYKIYVEDSEKGGSYTFRRNKITGKPSYAYFYNKTSFRGADAGFILSGGQENAFQNNGDLRVSYIKQFEDRANEQVLTIISEPGANEEYFEGLFFYEYEDKFLKEAYDELKQQQLEVDEYKDGYIKGKIDCKGEKDLMFLSIPYDRGWKAKVDGIEVEAQPIFNNAFIALRIPSKGKHDIEMIFEAQGAQSGIWISAVFCIVLVFVTLRAKLVRKDLKCMQ